MKWWLTIAQLDVQLFLWLHEFRYRLVLAHLSKWVSKTGDGMLYLVIPMVLALKGMIPWSWLLALSLIFALERACYWLLKNGLKRNRPADFLPFFNSFVKPSDRFSFPSGHSSAAFLFAGFLVLVFPGMMLPIFLWSAAIALSRVFLGVHFPGDVLVGSCMGFLFSLLLRGLL